MERSVLGLAGHCLKSAAADVAGHRRACGQSLGVIGMIELVFQLQWHHHAAHQNDWGHASLGRIIRYITGVDQPVQVANERRSDNVG